MTRDHVIPKSLFIELDPQMVTVPACDRCQRIKGQGDRDLELFVTLDIFGSHHPDNLEHAEKIVERNERTRQWLIQALEHAEEVSLVTDAGIELSQALSIDFNFDRIMIMMRMVLRGLYYHEYEEVLSKTTPTSVKRVPWNRGLDILQRFSPFRDGEPVEKGKRVAFWRRMPIDAKINKEDSFWVICFNDAVVFLGATGSIAHLLEGAQQAEDREPGGRDSESRSVPAATLLQIRRKVTLPKDPSGNYILPPSLRGG